MAETKSVKITNAGLLESPLRGGSIILRGVIHKDSLRHLKFDEYQREAPSLAKQADLVAALQAGQPLPDVEIGVRGGRVRSVEDEWIVQDDCYVIDGQRRVRSCLEAMTRFPNLGIYLGGCLHFDTDPVWERQRFHVLNANRDKLNPNVLLRNMREDFKSLTILYNLATADSAFPLFNRVSWTQNMKRDTLVTALTVLRASSRLHSYIARGTGSSIDELARHGDAVIDKIGTTIYRNNIKHFFDVVDDVWGIRNVAYRELARYLSGGFLMVLGDVFRNHEVFWTGGGNYRLLVTADWRRKLKGFPMNDPNIWSLVASYGSVRTLLYGKLVDHLNSGKRTKRLKPRHASKDDNKQQEAA